MRTIFFTITLFLSCSVALGQALDSCSYYKNLKALQLRFPPIKKEYQIYYDAAKKLEKKRYYTDAWELLINLFSDDAGRLVIDSSRSAPQKNNSIHIDKESIKDTIKMAVQRTTTTKNHKELSYQISSDASYQQSNMEYTTENVSQGMLVSLFWRPQSSIISSIAPFIGLSNSNTIAGSNFQLKCFSGYVPVSAKIESERYLHSLYKDSMDNIKTNVGISLTNESSMNNYSYNLSGSFSTIQYKFNRTSALSNFKYIAHPKIGYESDGAVRSIDIGWKWSREYYASLDSVDENLWWHGPYLEAALNFTQLSLLLSISQLERKYLQWNTKVSAYDPACTKELAMECDFLLESTQNIDMYVETEANILHEFYAHAPFAPTILRYAGTFDDLPPDTQVIDTVHGCTFTITTCSINPGVNFISGCGLGCGGAIELEWQRRAVAVDSQYLDNISDIIALCMYNNYYAAIPSVRLFYENSKVSIETGFRIHTENLTGLEIIDDDLLIDTDYTEYQPFLNFTVHPTKWLSLSSASQYTVHQDSSPFTGKKINETETYFTTSFKAMVQF